MSALASQIVTDPLVIDQFYKDAGSFALNGHHDTTNLTSFAEFSDLGSRFTRNILTESIALLASEHPYLRSTFKINGDILERTLLSETKLTIKYYQEDPSNPNQWRDILKKELAPRFIHENQPAFRVAFVEGDKKGTVFLTFRHDIADGLSAAAAMNRLFVIASQLIEGLTPKIIEINPELPNLTSLYPADMQTQPSTKNKLFPKPVDYQPCYTDFLRHVLDEDLTAKIEQCSKNSGGKFTVHSLLYAAFITAVKEVKNPSYTEFLALSIVSFRKELNAGDALRPLFTWLLSQCNSTTSFFELAAHIKDDLHGKIKRGEHKFNLLTTLNRLNNEPFPADILEESKMPGNLINLSNIGKIAFDGNYGAIKMTALDAAGGCTPYFDYAYQSGGINCSLAARTFQDCIRFVANFPRRQTETGDDENVRNHQKILEAIERILREHLQGD